MQHTGAVKAADCRTLLWSAGDYIFYDIFGEKQAAFNAWIDILRIVELSTADYDNPNAYEEMAQLKIFFFRRTTLYFKRSNMPRAAALGRAGRASPQRN